jgi:hypothetical protein
MARVSGRRVHRRWRLALRALTGAAAVLWVLSPYMARAGATTTPLPTVNLYGEGGWDVATEVTNWHNGVYAATAADPVDTHYVLEGDLNAQTDFLTGTADYLISGVPFQAKSSTGLPGGASNVIAAPIMSTGLGALVVAPLTGFQNIKLNSTITYGPLSEARPAPPDGTQPTGCPAPGCPPINVPNLNLVAMVDSFAGQFQQDQNGNLWTDDYWSNPEIYGSWDQSALQYNAAEGDSLVPQVAPDPITRSDPNDENYYFERWAGAVAPSIWKYPGSPNEFMPVSFADEFQGPGLASEIGLIQQEGGVGGFGGGGAVALVPPSGLSDLYATETSQPYSLTNEPTIAQWIGVQNANGDFVTPNPAAVEAGVDAGAAAGEAPCSATNQNALYAATNKVPGAYPLTWVDCLYAPTKGLSIAKTDALAGFIRYLVTDGQNSLHANGDAALPEQYVFQALAAANQVVTSNCPSAGGAVVLTSQPVPYAPIDPGVQSIGAVDQCETAPTPPASTTTTTVRATTATTAAPSTLIPLTGQAAPPASGQSPSASAATANVPASGQPASSGFPPSAGGAKAAGRGSREELSRTGQTAGPATSSQPQAIVAANLPEPLQAGATQTLDRATALVVGAFLFLLARAIWRKTGWVIRA